MAPSWGPTIVCQPPSAKRRERNPIHKLEEGREHHGRMGVCSTCSRTPALKAGPSPCRMSL
eukprot:2143422-Alexandrium_andersonii.AAC.1